MFTPVWPPHALVHGNLAAAAVGRDNYVSLVTWPQTETVYALSQAQEISADINVSKAWAEHQTAVARIRTLNVNWDGDDSVPPSYAVWYRADIFLRILRDREPTSPPKRIIASPDGLIAFEWYEGDAFMRAEVSESEQVEWMFSIPGLPTEFKTETIAELAAPVQGQVWQPAKADAPAFASELY